MQKSFNFLNKLIKVKRRPLQEEEEEGKGWRLRDKVKESKSSIFINHTRMHQPPPSI